MAVDVHAIAQQIISQAVEIGGDTWQRIRQSAPFFVEGYAQVVAKTSLGVAKGEIGKADGRMIVQNARLLLAQGIANTSQIILSQVQKFLDGVLAIVKGSINAALPFPIL
jgi:hypothetical protein